MSLGFLAVLLIALLCLGRRVLDCVRGADGVVQARLGWRWLGVVPLARDREFVFDAVELSPVRESGTDPDGDRVDRSYDQVVLKSSGSRLVLDEGWQPPELVAERLRAFLADRGASRLRLTSVSKAGLFWAVFLVAAGLFVSIALE